jgi:hypothetical protein
MSSTSLMAGHLWLPLTLLRQPQDPPRLHDDPQPLYQCPPPPLQPTASGAPSLACAVVEELLWWAPSSPNPSNRFTASSSPSSCHAHQSSPSGRWQRPDHRCRALATRAPLPPLLSPWASSPGWASPSSWANYKPAHGAQYNFLFSFGLN